MRNSAQHVSGSTVGIIAIVLTLALAVAATGYLLLPTPSEAQRPVITLSEPQADGPLMRVFVSGAEPLYPLATYRALLLADNVSEGDLNPLVDGGADGSLSFSDIDGDGSLSVGDRFTTDSQVVGDFFLEVLWESQQSGIQGWRRTVSASFAHESPTLDGFAVDVDAASPLRPLSEFSASLSRDSAGLGWIGSLSGGARSGNLTFYDLDGDGRLTAGDRAAIDTLEYGAYRVRLLWRADPVADRSWSFAPPSGSPVVTWCCLGGSYHTSFGISIGSVDTEFPLAEFRAVLLKNGTLFNEINPLSVPPPWQHLRFMDMYNNGLLSVGDRFSFECSPEQEMSGCTLKLPYDSNYVLRLYRGDAIVAVVSFSR